MPTSAVQRQDAGIRTLIGAPHGYAVVPEFDARGPRAYTVGLAADGDAEVIVFGLPDVMAAHLLQAVVARHRSGEDLGAGTVLRGVVERDYPLMVIQVDGVHSDEFLPAANRFYRLADAVRAWQIVYPDVHGLFPWQPGSLLADMPLLGPVPA